MFGRTLLLANHTTLNHLGLPGRKTKLVQSTAYSAVGMAPFFLLLLGSLAMFWGKPAYAVEGPTILKNTMQVSLWQNNGYWRPGVKDQDFSVNSWFPQVTFRVRGPITGGSQFIIEYTRADGSVWAQVPCPTEEIPADRWVGVMTERDSSPEGEKKYTTAVGPFGFKIRLKNELAGTNQVLYTGKFTIGKVSKFNGTPVTKNKYDYYIDHDWALPIGYLWFKPDTVVSPLSATMWFKGNTNGTDLSAYVFYKGKQIASTKEYGSASSTDMEVRTVSGDAGDPTWQAWIMTWYTIAEKATDPNNPNERLFYLDKNPGEYEIKVLRKGTLCRQAAFTVGTDGKITIPGTTGVNDPMISRDRMIMPVKVLGTMDGTWNKAAWQTEGYYGSPLKGVSLLP